MDPARSSRTPSQPDKHLFGTRQDQAFGIPAFSDDYEARFPPDAYCEETSPNARIWRVYMEEAAAFDANMIGQSRDGLDVMLVFAGLFSAVVTSFLVQVSQNLQPDFGKMTAILLHDVVYLQLPEGSPISNNTLPSTNPHVAFSADAIDVWINGLWAVSLTMSLLVALSAVLVKQWLHHYMTLTSGTARDRMYVRQYRFQGFTTWHVSTIIGTLPIVMHISLLLFLSGLTLFYIPLCHSLAYSVGTLTVLIAVIYLIVNTIPVHFPQCPYRTPFVGFLEWVYCGLVLAVRDRALSLYQRLRPRDAPWPTADVQKAEERSTVLEIPRGMRTMGKLEVDAIDWLLRISSNPQVHRISLQAIGGIPLVAQPYAVRTFRSSLPELHIERETVDYMRSQNYAYEGQSGLTFERLCRSILFCGRNRTLFRWPHERIRSAPLPLDDWRSCDPRITATYWATIEPTLLRQTDVREFLHLHSPALVLHSEVWKELLRKADMIGVFAMPEATQFMGQLLKIFFLSGSGPLFGPHALEARLKSVHGRSTWINLLNKSPEIESYYTPTIPMSLRHSSPIFSLAAGRFAVDHILTADGGESDQCLFVLNCVLQSLYTHRFNRRSLEETVLTQTFVQDILRNPRICDDLFSAPKIPSYRWLFSIYRQLSVDPAFDFQEFSAVCRIPKMEDIWDSDVELEIAREAIGIISTALSRGIEEAYRRFVGDAWIDDVLAAFWLIHTVDAEHSEFYILLVKDTLYRTPVDGYISGLSAPSLPSAMKDKYLAYLHRPHHLLVAFLLSIRVSRDRGTSGLVLANLDEIQRLAGVCPRHSSWAEVRVTVSKLIDWHRTLGHGDSGPDFPLMSFFGGRVLVTRTRKFDLDLELRTLFSRTSMGDTLGIALHHLEQVLSRGGHGSPDGTG